MDLSYICMYYISVLCTRVVCTSYHMVTRVLVNSLHVENKFAKDSRGHVITVFFYDCQGMVLCSNFYMVESIYRTNNISKSLFFGENRQNVKGCGM